MGVQVVEIEGEDGSKFAIGPQETVFGRGCGFSTNDRTVSRRHVSFQLNNNNHSESSEGGSSSSSSSRVSFEVIGRNPIWVCSHSHNHKHQSLKFFRKFEKGHLQFGDRFSLSAKTPLWFHLSSNNEVLVPVPVPELHRETEGSSSRVDLDFDKIDLSQIDPVKEFGFLVMGHEFDQYPKGKIRDVKDWEWFLDEPSKDSDEEEEGKEKRKMKRKRKKDKDNEDEEWGGETEDDKDIVARIRKGKRPVYSTRSKDSEKGPNRGTKGGSTSSKRKKNTEEDENDETLGGFIVDNEEDDKEEDDKEEEEEEEEFQDDEDDDED